MIENNSKVVFFGDSLTHRTGVTMSSNPAQRFTLDYAGSYVDILLKKILVHFPDVNFESYNMGIGGNTVPDLLDRMDDVITLSPDWIVLFIGQNDANRYSPSEYKDNLDKLLNLFQEKGIRVIQLSTTPSPDNKKNETLAEYDQIIQRLSKKYNNPYIEVKESFNKILKINETAENPIKVFNQGCHMSQLGNILIADLVFDVLSGI
ncbi:MAG: GDSL-type esterase/lipase family protein [Spirochaetaceae bacterium]